MAITMAIWKFVASQPAQSHFGTSHSQRSWRSKLIGSVSYKARALCVAAAKHVVANKQTLTRRMPEHITSRQEMTASANFHQLRDVIE